MVIDLLRGAENVGFGGATREMIQLAFSSTASANARICRKTNIISINH